METGEKMWSIRPQAQLEDVVNSTTSEEGPSSLYSDLNRDPDLLREERREDDGQVVNLTTSPAPGVKEEEKDVVNSTTCAATGLKEEKEEVVDLTTSPARRKKYSQEARDATLYLKEKLRAQGITIFEPDWHLKSDAVAESMIEKLGAGDVKLGAKRLRKVIDWASAHHYWHDKIDSMYSIQKAIKEWQRKNGGGGNGGTPTAEGNSDRRYTINPTTKLPTSRTTPVSGGPSD